VPSFPEDGPSRRSLPPVNFGVILGVP
jgi:hypothetical protein